MPFSRRLLSPFVPRYDNIFVSYTNCGQFLIPKPLEHGLILSKPHSGAGPLDGHFY